MKKSRTIDPVVLFSVPGVSRMMNVPKEAVRDAIRLGRLRTEMILIGDRIGVSIPLQAIAEFWSLPEARVQMIEKQARQGTVNAPVSIVTPLISQ